MFIKRDIGRKSRFFLYPLAFDALPPLLGPRQSIVIPFGTEKIVATLYGEKKFADMISCFDRIPACDRQTDGQTCFHFPHHSTVRAMHTRRAVKMKPPEMECDYPRQNNLNERP